MEPFEGVETAVSHHIGIQAQILQAGAVSQWNRTSGLTYSQFENLSLEERRINKLWGQRGTLHFYASQEWPLIYAAFAQKGMAQAQYQTIVQEMLAILRQKQIIGRSDLRANMAIDDELLSSWGGLFQEMVYGGHACHAGKRGNEGLFAHRQHWLPDLVWEPPDTEAANIELLRRYLRGYGPATLQDFAYWRGAGVGNGRRWLQSLQNETTEVDVDGQTMLLLADDLDILQAIEATEWPIRLLYRFDPYLLAHKDKSWLIDMKYYKRIWQAAGHIEGTVLDLGRIVGTWRYDRKGGGLVVTVTPFGRLRRGVRTAVRQQAAHLAKFFDLALRDVQWMMNP
jgi:hypothetical protein